MKNIQNDVTRVSDSTRWYRLVREPGQFDCKHFPISRVDIISACLRNEFDFHESSFGYSADSLYFRSLMIINVSST